MLKNKQDERSSVLVGSLIALSLGRMDPAFIPLQAAGLTANQISYYLICVALFIASIRYMPRWRIANIFFLSTLALTIWACLSSQWSLSSLMALAKGLSYVILLFSCLTLAVTCDETTFIRGSIKGALIILVLSTLLALALPNSAGTTMFHDGAWRGLFMQKNVLGRAAMLGGIFAIAGLLIFEDKKDLRMAKLLLLIAVVVLIKSRSVTSMSAMVAIPVAALLLLRLRKLPIQVRLTFAVALPIFVAAVVLSAPYIIELFTAQTGKSADLTGRVPLWIYSIEKIKQQLWTGYGVEGFWGTYYAAEFIALQKWEPDHSHNGFIDITLELGIVGLVLMLLSLIWFILNIPKPEGGMKSISILMSITACLMVILNLTESNLFRSSNSIYLFYLFLGLRVSFLKSGKVKSLSIPSKV